MEDLRDPGCPTLGELELLEEFADAAIAVTPRHGPASSEVIESDGAIRSWKTDDRKLVRCDADFDRFPFLVAAVVDGVDDSLLNRRVREVRHAGRLGPVRMLDHRLADVVASNVIERLSHHAMERSAKGLLGEAVAPRFIGEPDHVDLGLRKKPVRLEVEEEQPDIEGERRLRGAPDNVHLTPQLDQRERGGQGSEIAADLREELRHQVAGEIVHLRPLVDAVVEGHRGGKREQFRFIGSCGPDGAGTLADEVTPVATILGQGDSRPIRAGLTAGDPDDEDDALVDLVRHDDGVIRRPDRTVPQLQNLLLDGVEPSDVEALWR